MIDHNQNLNQIAGQEHAKRAIEVALAGNHSLLIEGPPNSGKSMLLHAAAVMCYTADDPLLAPTVIDSYGDLIRWRPESLHNNALTLAGIRPCACGNYGDDLLPCACGLEAIAGYKQTVALYQPYIQLHVTIIRPPAYKLKQQDSRETSNAIMRRVVAARAFAAARSQSKPNGLLPLDELSTHAPLHAECQRLLEAAQKQGYIDAASWNNTIRIARTAADLAGDEQIQLWHVAEAIQYRPRRLDSVITEAIAQLPAATGDLAGAYQKAVDALNSLNQYDLPLFMRQLIDYGLGKLPTKPLHILDEPQ